MTVKQLNNSLMTICKQYRKLSVSTRESLTKRGIMPGELIALLQDFVSSSTDQKEESLLAVIGHLINPKNLPEAKSIAEIFHEIAPSMTFLDYDILKHIIDTYGNDTDKENLTQYEEDLEKFLGSWEVPHNRVKIPRTEGGLRDDQVQMCFKLKSLKHMPYYPELKKKIASIFNVAECAIILISIEEGCLEFVFLFPKIAVERLLPLAPIQEMQLAEIVPSVLRVKIVSQSLEQVIFQVRMCKLNSCSLKTCYYPKFQLQSTNEGSQTNKEASTESNSESAKVKHQGESSWVWNAY